MAFDWTNLFSNTVAPLGGKILGQQLGLDPNYTQAQTGQQNSQFNNELNAAKFNQSTQAKKLALPGMLETLGYSPETASASAKSFGSTNPSTTFGSPATSLSAPSSGPNIGRTALGAGLTLAPALLSGLGSAGAVGGSVLGTGLAGLGPTVAGSATGLGSLAGAGTAASTAGGGGAGLLGLGATVPIVGAVAAGLIGAGLLWKKSQVHPTADKWVHGEQNPFDQTMANIDTQVKSGSMTPDEAKQLKTKNAQTYLSELQQFSTQGGHENIVARQAAQTFRQYYGDPAQYGIALSI